MRLFQFAFTIREFGPIFSDIRCIVRFNAGFVPRKQDSRSHVLRRRSSAFYFRGLLESAVCLIFWHFESKQNQMPRLHLFSVLRGRARSTRIVTPHACVPFLALAARSASSAVENSTKKASLFSNLSSHFLGPPSFLIFNLLETWIRSSFSDGMLPSRITYTSKPLKKLRTSSYMFSYSPILGSLPTQSCFPSSQYPLSYETASILL